MAALTDHRDKMSRFQRLRSVFSVEWDEVDPARVVKQPGRMQAQRLFSDLLRRSSCIIVVALPLNQRVQKRLLARFLDE